MLSPENLDHFQLPYILSRFRRCRDDTDPRDRIYGMLGLARARYENAVVTDYTQSVETALTTAVTLMISKLWLVGHSESYHPWRDFDNEFVLIRSGLDIVLQ